MAKRIPGGQCVASERAACESLRGGEGPHMPEERNINETVGKKQSLEREAQGPVVDECP